MKTKRKRDICFYFTCNNSLQINSCSRNSCRLCDKSIMYISVEIWYLQRVWKFTSKYLPFVLKKKTQTSKCLIHPYKMPALGLGKTEGMFHPWYGLPQLPGDSDFLDRCLSAHTPHQLPPLYWAKCLCLHYARKSHR